MGPLRMTWYTEKGRLVCRWVDVREASETRVTAPRKYTAQPLIRPRRNSVDRPVGTMAA